MGKGVMIPALSATLRALVEEAQGRGFTVTHAGNCVTIYKARGKSVTLGVMIFTSDTGAFFQAIRADTELDACTAIRTIKGVRRALELLPRINHYLIRSNEQWNSHTRSITR